MNEYLIVAICIAWVICGKGCEVMAKESNHVDTSHKYNFIIIFAWPLILFVAALERGE